MRKAILARSARRTRPSSMRRAMRRRCSAIPSRATSSCLAMRSRRDSFRSSFESHRSRDRRSTTSPSRRTGAPSRWGVSPRMIRRRLRRRLAPSGGGVERRRERARLDYRGPTQARLDAPTRMRPMPKRYRALSSRASPRNARPPMADGGFAEVGRAQPLQADGLQGRVRGRAPLHGRRIPEAAEAPVRRRFHAGVQSRAAARRKTRSQTGHLEEACIRAVDVERR